MSNLNRKHEELMKKFDKMVKKRDLRTKKTKKLLNKISSKIKNSGGSKGQKQSPKRSIDLKSLLSEKMKLSMNKTSKKSEIQSRPCSSIRSNGRESIRSAMFQSKTFLSPKADRWNNQFAILNRNIIEPQSCQKGRTGSSLQIKPSETAFLLATDRREFKKERLNTDPSTSKTEENPSSGGLRSTSEQKISFRASMSTKNNATFVSASSAKIQEKSFNSSNKSNSNYNSNNTNPNRSLKITKNVREERASHYFKGSFKKKNNTFFKNKRVRMSSGKSSRASYTLGHAKKISAISGKDFSSKVAKGMKRDSIELSDGKEPSFYSQKTEEKNLKHNPKTREPSKGSKVAKSFHEMRKSLSKEINHKTKDSSAFKKRKSVKDKKILRLQQLNQKIGLQLNNGLKRGSDGVFSFRKREKRDAHKPHSKASKDLSQGQKKQKRDSEYTYTPKKGKPAHPKINLSFKPYGKIKRTPPNVKRRRRKRQLSIDGMENLIQRKNSKKGEMGSLDSQSVRKLFNRMGKLEYESGSQRRISGSGHSQRRISGGSNKPLRTPASELRYRGSGGKKQMVEPSKVNRTSLRIPEPQKMTTTTMTPLTPHSANSSQKTLRLNMKKDERIKKLEADNLNLKEEIKILKSELKSVRKHLSNFLVIKNEEVEELKAKTKEMHEDNAKMALQQQNLLKKYLESQEECRKLTKLMQHYPSQRSIIEQHSKESSCSVMMSNFLMDELKKGSDADLDFTNINSVQGAELIMMSFLKERGASSPVLKKLDSSFAGGVGSGKMEELLVVDESIVKRSGTGVDFAYESSQE